MFGSKVKKETIEIRRVLEKYVKLKNSSVQEGYSEIDMSNFYVNEINYDLNAFGCFFGRDGWYAYYIDERSGLMVNGPYDVHGIIHALACQLYIPSQIYDEELTDAEEEIFYAGYQSADKLGGLKL